MTLYTYNSSSTEYRARTLLALARKVEHSSKAELHIDRYNQNTNDPYRLYYAVTPGPGGNGWNVGACLGLYDRDEVEGEGGGSV
jgi:hypothetical protein